MSITFNVEGMKCGNCTSKIEQSIRVDFPDVNIEFDLDEKSVAIESSDAINPLNLKKIIEQSGFSITKMG